METVKKSSLGLIKSVFNSNTDNTQHYTIINKMFNGKVENLEFAKPIIQTKGGYILWKANTIGPYIPFSELKDENQKNKATQMVQSALKTIEQKAKDYNESVDFIDKIIEIPNEDSIYFTKTDNTISIILTEWGFTNDEFKKGQGVLKKVFMPGLKSFVIAFKNSDGEDLEGIKCNISINGKETAHASNNKGFITLNDISINDVITLKSPQNEFAERTIEINDKNEETIILDEVEDLFEEEFEEEELPIIDSPFEETQKNITVEILNWRKKPIENQLLSFYGLKNGKENFTTDQHGQFQLNSLDENKEYSIFMEYKNMDWKQDFTHSNTNEKYTFIVKKKKLLWWWLPLIIGFFFLLSLIPTDINHHFVVYDNQTKQPIAGSEINNNSGYLSQSLSNITNVEGEFSLNLGRGSIFSQIFNGFKSNFSASKSGYESVSNQPYSVAYFKSNMSKVYLDPITTDTIHRKTKPLPNKSDCNSDGDADDAGGNSVREYDMSQNSGVFTFEYNTGNKLPDIINIYDCSSKEINTSKLIWSFNNVTQGNAYETITFNNQIITVEVIGGGVIESIWSYRVNCP